MRKESEFLRDLNRDFDIVEMPFIIYFKENDDLKNSLFTEYLQTALKPNFVLYSEKYLTADELSKRNNEKKELKLWSEFIKLINNKQLPEEFYTHLISETNIFKKLRFVEKRIDDFEKNFALVNPFDYGIDFAKSIIYELDTLKLPKLKKVVLIEFIEKKENSYITLMFAFNENTKYISKDDALKKYEDYKDSIKNYIVENLKNDNSTNQNEATKHNIESLIKEQNNLLSKVSIQEVYNHFEILTKKTNKKGEFHLKNEQLLNFIYSTFVTKNPKKQDFICDGFIKKEVRKIFYNFYTKFKNKETNQTNLKSKYFNIMNDAFNGFSDNDYNDFHK